jgi:hypothetical protein
MQVAAPSVDTMTYLCTFITVMHRVDVSLWLAQNTYNEVWQRDYGAVNALATSGDARAQAWVAAFRRLGGLLTMAIDSTDAISKTV